VFENRVLRRIFDHKRDGVIREGRKLHNKELYDLYSSPDIIIFGEECSHQEERDCLGMWHVWGQETCVKGFGGET